MIGQAVGAVGTFAAFGGFGEKGPFAKSQQDTPPVENTLGEDQVIAKKDELYTNYISDRAEEYINTAPNFGSLPPEQQNVMDIVSDIPTNPYAGMGITDEAYKSMQNILGTIPRIR